MKATVEMMVESMNKKGGINGHPIQLTVYDAASEVTKGVTAANRLITQDQVDIISGAGNMSGISLALKPVANRNQIPIIGAILEP